MDFSENNLKIKICLLKSLVVFLYFLYCNNAVFSQNLVPNPGFEIYNNCPSGFTSMDTSSTSFPSVDSWYEPNFGTADYYQYCGDWITGIPQNFSGFQYPHSGNAYCGIIMYSTQAVNAREYLQVKLTQPLEAGKYYCVQFYVAVAEGMDLFSQLGNHQFSFNAYGINAIGAYFSKTPVENLAGGGSLLNFTPQVTSDASNMLTDSIHWTLISGLYQATGVEKYLTLGCFKNDAQLQKILINPGFGNELYGLSYYYLDDISVTETHVILPE